MVEFESTHHEGADLQSAVTLQRYRIPEYMIDLFAWLFRSPVWRLIESTFIYTCSLVVLLGDNATVRLSHGDIYMIIIDYWCFDNIFNIANSISSHTVTEEINVISVYNRHCIHILNI